MRAAPTHVSIVPMSPDDLSCVERSWCGLRPRRDALTEQVAASLAASGQPECATERAAWLVDAVGELVDLLRAPSELDRYARRLAATWPCPGTAPSFRFDGTAWMAAAAAVVPAWDDTTEQAWCQAWLLLADVLAEGSLAPFGKPGTAGVAGPYVVGGAKDT
jgi:hypothetical protein